MDTVTYPDVSVETAISTHYVPVKLELGRADRRDQVRALGPLWTPTFFMADHRGRELRRDVGFLTPPDFVAALAIGAGLGLAATGRAEAGGRVVEEAIAAHGDGPFAAELLYWRGALGFLETYDHAELRPWWDRLRQAYPESPWARRCVIAEDEAAGSA